MKECLVCKQIFEPKNPKGVYCSSVCRQKDYRRRLAPVIENGRKINDLANFSDLTTPTNVLKPKEPPKANFSANTTENHNEAILEQIKALKAEKIPNYRNKSEWGRKSWRQEQEKRIKELQDKLIDL